MALHRGDLERATACFAEALGEAQAIGQQQRVAACLVGIATVAAATRDWARAAQLLGAAEALSGAIGTPMAPPDRRDFEQSEETVRDALDDAAFSTARAAGRALSLEAAIALALAERNWA